MYGAATLKEVCLSHIFTLKHITVADYIKLMRNLGFTEREQRKQHHICFNKPNPTTPTESAFIKIRTKQLGDSLYTTLVRKSLVLTGLKKCFCDTCVPPPPVFAIGKAEGGQKKASKSKPKKSAK